MRKANTVASLLVLAGLCGASGCGSKPEAVPATAENELQEIYRICRGGGKGGSLAVPKSLNQVLSGKFQNVYGLGVPALEDGHCVLIWGADPAKTPDQAGTVLGYEKETPSQGGYVLMMDGTVKKMTAEEFQAARKAQS
jgi:hypothetical protein